MTKTWLLVLGLGALGAAGVYLAAADEPADEPAEVEAESPKKERSGEADARDARGENPSLERRVRRLEKDIRELRAQLGMRRFASASDDREHADDEAGEQSGLVQGELRDQVREVMTEEREERFERERERRRERLQERSKEWIATIAEKGGSLSAKQGEDLTGLWVAEQDSIMSAVAEGRSGDRAWPEVRESIQQTRQEYDGQIQDLLDDRQYSAYRELRDERDSRWGGGGRRGRGG